MKTQNDVYKTSRFLYVLEAAFEYFISLLVTGAYLAKVTSAINMSDSLTGILTSFVSLGCAFQCIALFLSNKRPVKTWVTFLHTLNQLFFALVYLVPFIHVSQTAKMAVFILLLLSAHALNNVVNAPKINWFMSLIDDKKRGSFTATKEIVSLLGGMAFTFLVGRVMDSCEAAGNTAGAFAFCGIGIFILMLLHSASLLFSKEKPQEQEENVPTKQLLGELVKDKSLFKIILVSVLWSIANYATVPFYGTYQIKELGFSMTFISILSAAYSLLRALCSRPLGRYADKRSFAKMLNVCFCVQLAAFAVATFTVPANGNVFYTTYYMLQAVAMAGINSGAINLIFDYVDKEKRMGALALKMSLSGIAGFLTTLAISPLVSYIQQNNNVFLGLPVYAQQVVSCIGFVVVLGILLYLNTVVKTLSLQAPTLSLQAQTLDQKQNAD